MQKLSIIIPVWNEEKTISQLLEKVASIELPQIKEREIIVVNDGSTDNTWEIIQEVAKFYPFIHAYSNSNNCGKSQTVRNGILKSNGDVVIIQDADFEYEPNDIPKLLELMNIKGLDVVYGNRFGLKNKKGYVHNYYGNIFLSIISNIFTYKRIKTWIPDMEVCYKLINGDIAREVAKNIVSTSRFGLEPEITARLSKYKLNEKNLKFGIVPINYYPRTVAEGKKMNAIEDGINALKEIIRFNIVN